MGVAVGIRLFIIGILTAGIALILLACASLISEVVFDVDLKLSSNDNGVQFIILALFVGALIEEVLRAVTLRRVLFHDSRITHPLFGAVLFGAGFAFTEVVLFFTSRGTISFLSPTLITTPLLHIALSILIVTMLLQLKNRRALFFAVGLPVLIHTLYNSFLI